MSKFIIIIQISFATHHENKHARFYQKIPLNFLLNRDNLLSVIPALPEYITFSLLTISSTYILKLLKIQTYIYICTYVHTYIHIHTDTQKWPCCNPTIDSFLPSVLFFPITPSKFPVGSIYFLICSLFVMKGHLPLLS